MVEMEIKKCLILIACLYVTINVSFAQEKERKQWFKKTVFDAGKVFEGKKIYHEFEFKNPYPVPHKIKWLQKTCSCAQAWLILNGKEIPFNDVVLKTPVVRPGQTGKVKLLLDMTGIRGIKEAEVTVGLDDRKKDYPTLVLKATGIVYFEITPPNISLGELKWNEKKEFRFSVTSKHIKQWKILGWDPLPEGIKLEPPEMEKTKEGIVYKFKGTLGPGIPPGPAGGTIRLRTDFKGHVIEVSVAAEVKRPYKVTPRGFLGFGRVVRSRGKERIIKIVNQEKDKALKILSVRLVGLNKPR